MTTNMDSYDKSNIPTDEYVKLYDSLYKQLGRPPRKAELEQGISEYNRRSNPDRNR